MAYDTVLGKWNQLKSEASVHWRGLSDHELEAIDGQVDRLVDLVQQRYGRTREQAVREVNRFLDSY